jgi:hypothetical protein
MTSKTAVLPDKEIEEQRATQDDVYIDPVAEKALLRKLDMWIVPPVMLLYLLSFLDRVNIGNARLYGMEEDLGLVGDQVRAEQNDTHEYLVNRNSINLQSLYFSSHTLPLNYLPTLSSRSSLPHDGSRSSLYPGALSPP